MQSEDGPRAQGSCSVTASTPWGPRTEKQIGNTKALGLDKRIMLNMFNGGL